MNDFYFKEQCDIKPSRTISNLVFSTSVPKLEEINKVAPCQIENHSIEDISKKIKNKRQSQWKRTISAFERSSLFTSASSSFSWRMHIENHTSHFNEIKGYKIVNKWIAAQCLYKQTKKFLAQVKENNHQNANFDVHRSNHKFELLNV